jgi:iron complex outermembrane receptor protein
LTGDEIDGWSIFGEVSIGFGEKFDLTFGYRFHDQEADQYGFNVDLGVAAGVTAPKPLGPNMEFTQGNIYEGIRQAGTDQHVAFDADTFRVAGSYRFTDNVMGYIGYTEGFNSGGLAVYQDCQGPVQSAYDPETIENTELGIRSDLANGRLRINATYFSTDWVDIQLLATVRDRCTGQELTELVSQNAASATADGVELEMSFAASDSVLLQANIGFLDTEYTSTRSPAVTLATEFSAAPDATYNFGVEHTGMLQRGGRLVTRFDTIYTGNYWRSPVPSLRRNAYGVANDYESGDYWRFNAQMAYTPPDGRYQVTLYGTNLSNEYELNSGFLHNIWQFDFATVDRPREVGVALRMNF